MIIRITSHNNQLHDLLLKNPNTDYGLYLKPLKNGIMVGNCVDINTYEVLFQDSMLSYGFLEDNQMDYQSYCFPLVVLHICTELFGHLLKPKQDYYSKPIKWLGLTPEDIDNQVCKIQISSFFMDSNWCRNGVFLLSKYFQEIEITQQYSRIFSLTIEAKNVFEAFNFLVLNAIFTHTTNIESPQMYIDDLLALKFGRILTNLNNVPYFVFYLFNLRVLKSPKQFEVLKPIFETYLKKQGLDVDLVSRSNGNERVNYVVGLLDSETSIIDIGCGELVYFRKMVANHFLANYYAVDKDSQFFAISESVKKRTGYEQLSFYDNLNLVETEEKVNILLVEVIEHNPVEDAVKLLQEALKYNFEKIIVTTPNSSFNQFYRMDETMRYDDHFFEFNEVEFHEFIEGIVLSENLSVSYFGLGDSINGIQPTQGCVITKINQG